MTVNPPEGTEGTEAFRKLFDARYGRSESIFLVQELNNLGNPGAFVDRFNDEAWAEIVGQARAEIDAALDG